MPRDQPPASGDDPRRDLLCKLYAPYKHLVFLPYLGASTLAWGAAATLTGRAISSRLAFHCGTAWAWLLCRANFTRVTVEGRERMAPGQSYVIMSNHQSHFDVLAFYGHFGRQFRWVIKQELRRVPGLGAGCAAVGHIFIDRSSRAAAIASLRAARPLLDGGVSLMIFPEGTRSPDGRLQPFKKGGFMLALELGLPILPVSISGSRQVLPGRSAALLPGKIRIEVHQPVDPTRYSDNEDGAGGRDALMQEVRRRIASGLTPWERGEGPRRRPSGHRDLTTSATSDTE